MSLLAQAHTAIWKKELWIERGVKGMATEENIAVGCECRVLRYHLETVASPWFVSEILMV